MATMTGSPLTKAQAADARSLTTHGGDVVVRNATDTADVARIASNGNVVSGNISTTGTISAGTLTATNVNATGGVSANGITTSGSLTANDITTDTLVTMGAAAIGGAFGCNGANPMTRAANINNGSTIATTAATNVTPFGYSSAAQANAIIALGNEHTGQINAILAILRNAGLLATT